MNVSCLLNRIVYRMKIVCVDNDGDTTGDFPNIETSVYHLRHIRPMSCDTFHVKASLRLYTVLLCGHFKQKHPSLYGPISRDLQMKSCMTFL